MTKTPKVKLLLITLTSFVLTLAVCSQLYVAPVKAAGKKTVSELQVASGYSATEKKKIRAIEKLITDTYSDYMKSTSDWLSQSLYVAGLSKLLTDDATTLLMKSLKGKVGRRPHPLVLLHSWEALHARSMFLTRKQHFDWVNYGLIAAEKYTKPGKSKYGTSKTSKCFVGDFRASLIKAAASYGNSADFKVSLDKLMILWLRDCMSHKNPSDYTTFVAMRKAVAQNKNPKTIQAIIRMLSNKKTFNGAEYVLGGLDSSYSPVGTVSKKCTPKDFGHAKKFWNNWLKTHKQELTNKIKQESKADKKRKLYTGKSKYFKQLILIGDKSMLPKTLVKNADISKIVKFVDRKKGKKIFLKDLEIKKLRVKNFDLVFAIDSTGSMASVMAWVSKDVVKILDAMKLVAKEPKIGVVYFRHEIDKHAMSAECCKRAKPQIINVTKKRRIPKTASKYPRFSPYSVKVFKMVAGKAVNKLSQLLMAEQAGGAHNGGAALGGIQAALKYNRWSKGSSSKKVIIVIGDTPMTKAHGYGGKKAPAGVVDSLEIAKKLMKKIKKKKFQVHFIRCDRGNNPRLRDEYAKLAKIIGGQNIHVKFPRSYSYHRPRPGKKPPVKRPSSKQLATPTGQSNTYGQILGTVLKSVIPENYRNKVDPVVRILMVYSASVEITKRNF